MVELTKASICGTPREVEAEVGAVDLDLQPQLEQLVGALVAVELVPVDRLVDAVGHFLDPLAQHLLGEVLVDLAVLAMRSRPNWSTSR